MANIVSPFSAYERTMALIRSRFVSLDDIHVQETMLGRAERVALNVRKTVEGVAWAALSAMEFRTGKLLRDQRTKDADKLLNWLNAKGALTLPSAQRIGQPTPDFPVVFEGMGSADMSLSQLQDAYKRASQLVHERHPELLTLERIKVDTTQIETDAQNLRAWLWLHMMFFKNRAFLVQMGKFGTPSFFVEITKEAELPPEYR